MAREDWIYINLDKPLVKWVDKTVNTSLKHGNRKYVDRKHFVVMGIQLLLDVEEGKKKIVNLEEAPTT